MTPLLEALRDAARVGFDAPKCPRCTDGIAVRHHPDDAVHLRMPEEFACPACHATGLDASDPERLIGRAMMRLHARNAIAFQTYAEPQFPPTIYLGPLDWPTDSMRHDGTPTGLATALLRLAARIGATKETP